MQQLTKYNISIQTFQNANFIKSGWAEATFYNAGTTTIILNGLPLVPGQSLAINGNQYEIDDTKYSWQFSGSGVNLLQIIAKYYANIIE